MVDESANTIESTLIQENAKEGYTVILFYKYAEVLSPITLKEEQISLCKSLGLLGRVLISDEGINATLASIDSHAIEIYIDQLITHDILKMNREDFKYSFHPDVRTPPFEELVIKHVKEIVSTGGTVKRPNSSVTDRERGYLSPQEFHEALQQALKYTNGETTNNESYNSEDTAILDVRAHKEFLVGHFQNAMDPQVKTFSDYYTTFLKQRMPELRKKKKILMYCTGGIRCEKASDFLRDNGCNEVYHLKGGIHKYLESYPDGGYFQGKNFVFDKRVLMAAAKHKADIVGNCIECSIPFDTFSGRKVCSVCRDLVLVCDDCFIQRHGEVHCTDHQFLKHCYVTFLQYTSTSTLLQHRECLSTILKEYEVTKGWKNKRRTIRNQLNKIAKHLEAREKCEEIEPELEMLDKYPIHCRTCGDATCIGDCWGFWMSH